MLPTYNESENIETVLRRVREVVPAADILVVDDGSPDGTADLAEKLGVDLGQVEVLRRTAKSGLGSAYRAGFRLGLERGYDAFVEMDSDLSHDPDALPSLLAASERGADLVIGSRYVPGGRTPHWPWYRLAISRGGNLYVRTLLGVPVRDATAGYRLFRRTALEAIDLATVQSTGYVFQTDMVVRCLRHGLRVREVPIEFVERVRGDSKMSGRVASESLARITAWGLRERREQLAGALRRS